MDDEHVVGSGSPRKPKTARESEARYPGHPLPGSLELSMSGRHERLLRLTEWIAKNTALTLTLKEAARITCLEPHYFSQVFRKHVGESFREWRSRYRISWAMLAMDHSPQNINDIIQASGYRNRRAFERAVKRITGMTPGRLRRHLLRKPLDPSAVQTP
jgi:two-component system response regulator YesN